MLEMRGEGEDEKGGMMFDMSGRRGGMMEMSERRGGDVQDDGDEWEEKMKRAG